MEKKLGLLLTIFILSITTTITSIAGIWRSDSYGWWWQNDNGSWPMNSWQWLDGDNNGIFECYYFDSHGYCLLNTKTPDGYYVNETGAWTENGTVQIRKTDNSKSDKVAKETQAEVKKVKALDLVTADTVTGGFDTFTGRHTVQGDTLSRGLKGRNNSSAEWYTGGVYSTFTAKLAINADVQYSSNVVMQAEVLDQDLDILDSMEIALRQSPQEFTVDISGTDYVTIRVTRLEGSSYDSNQLLFENPVFR